MTVVLKNTEKPGKKELLYGDHTEFNEAIEVIIKVLDKFDRFDRVFAIQQ